MQIKRILKFFLKSIMDNEILADIVVETFDGFTMFDSSFGEIYVKHFHQLETRKLLCKKSSLISKARKRGLLSGRIFG